MITCNRWEKSGPKNANSFQAHTTGERAGLWTQIYFIYILVLLLNNFDSQKGANYSRDPSDLTYSYSECWLIQFLHIRVKWSAYVLGSWCRY